MPIQNLFKFPSGRSVKRLKQDAKTLAKSRNIPLHQALDEIARLNGGSSNWDESIRAFQNQSPVRIIQPILKPQSRLAQELGITDKELELLTWDVQENSSDDGLIYDFILTFYEDCPPEILRKIDGLSNGLSVRVSANAFDEEPDPSEDFPAPFPIKTNMNPYRKLLVLGLNELVTRGLLPLEWDRKSNEETAHIETKIAGHNTIIVWSGIGFGEVRISVWWKYDHSRHPQANLSGNSRESFSGDSPLAKRQHYPKFVGVVSAGWLERRDGKYLQGKGNQGIFERYMRKGESEYLAHMPNPTPLGFAPEGRFHM